MTDNKQPEASELVQLLQGYANDPMWAEHAEVPKSLLRAAIKRINTLQMHAGDHLSLGNEIEVFRQQLFEKEQEWIASDLKRIAQIAALSSQQSTTKGEPQRQGGENVVLEEKVRFIKHVIVHDTECSKETKAALFTCNEILTILSSRPATVVDDAAVERAYNGFNQCSRDMIRERLSKALLTAFPQFNKEEKDK